MNFYECCDLTKKVYLIYLPSHKSHVLAHFFATQFLEHLPLFFHFLHFLAFAVSLQISSSSVHSPQVFGHFLMAQFLEHLPFESNFWHCFLLAISLQPKNISLLVENFFFIQNNKKEDNSLYLQKGRYLQ